SPSMKVDCSGQRDRQALGRVGDQPPLQVGVQGRRRRLAGRGLVEVGAAGHPRAQRGGEVVPPTVGGTPSIANMACSSPVATTPGCTLTTVWPIRPASQLDQVTTASLDCAYAAEGE